MNGAFRTTVLFLASMTAGAATCSGPPDQDQASVQKSLVTVADNVCEGQSDGAQPPGCDGGGECWFQLCDDQACSVGYSPGTPCGRMGTCDDNGRCVESDEPDPVCESRCEDQKRVCDGNCGEDMQCLCTCNFSYQWCKWGCGGPPPEQEVC
jgi:hypothetical protein